MQSQGLNRRPGLTIKIQPVALHHLTSTQRIKEAHVVRNEQTDSAPSSISKYVFVGSRRDLYGLEFNNSMIIIGVGAHEIIRLTESYIGLKSFPLRHRFNIDAWVWVGF